VRSRTWSALVWWCPGDPVGDCLLIALDGQCACKPVIRLADAGFGETQSLPIATAEVSAK
jgi:hypothetical protein